MTAFLYCTLPSCKNNTLLFNYQLLPSLISLSFASLSIQYNKSLTSMKKEFMALLGEPVPMLPYRDDVLRSKDLSTFSETTNSLLELCRLDYCRSSTSQFQRHQLHLYLLVRNYRNRIGLLTKRFFNIAIDSKLTSGQSPHHKQSRTDAGVTTA